MKLRYGILIVAFLACPVRPLVLLVLIICILSIMEEVILKKLTKGLLKIGLLETFYQ